MRVFNVQVNELQMSIIHESLKSLLADMAVKSEAGKRGVEFVTELSALVDMSDMNSMDGPVSGHTELNGWCL